jgi:DNA-binding IclR family transcriptional regulator
MPTEVDVVYPQINTRAAQILEYVKANPGTSRNGIISGLSLNPSVVRRYVQVLVERGLIRDSLVEGQHQIEAVEA